ncbi:sensor domain-containing diguanylate cyclase [uncultured Methylobacterium sp.]|mgnify:CR=1 FL=1|uniref:GGDEF domain-containing protein n=1 Tax=uncultured Methylobacterium sp. TaxID=157278 RepID=UPI0026193229|nr:sensor domain-containing diguanylate cyclase [uncultured Methylobacterium sp.]
MVPSRLPFLRPASPGTWILLGIMAPLGMMVVSALMLLELRQDAWDKAEQTSRNLLQVIERDVARNIELLDLSLRGVQDNLRAPGLDEASPEIRHLTLFDRATSAKDIGLMMVLDEHGRAVESSPRSPAPTGSFADRDYFRVHVARPDLGLYLGPPVVSRVTGERMLPLSRRITKPDGTFGGVALATLKLSYFRGLLDRLGLGRDGAINLYHRDGTRIMRHPYVEADLGTSIAGTANFDRFRREGSGSFTSVSVRDGLLRHYTFTSVGDLPLLLNVALSVDEIDAEWRRKAAVISGIVLVLSGLTIALVLMFAQELQRRTAIEGELARLSMTDMLTGLPNRRRFEEALDRAWGRAAASGRPLSLLVVDADHFKRYNDRYGHAVGDEILKGLAGALSESVFRPGDLVCRIGGEEFVVLLPGTDATGALSVADRVHEAVARIALAGAGIGAGSVTVSIGAAAAAQARDAADLLRLADEALYAAKNGGRNQTRSAAAPAATAALRLVHARQT